MGRSNRIERKTEWIDIRDRRCQVEWVSRKGQKYLRIRVKKDRIVVSGPKHLGRRALKQYLEDQVHWIEQKLEVVDRKKARLRDQLEAKRGFLMVRGQWKPVRTVARRGGRREGILWDRNGVIEYHLPAGHQMDYIAEEARVHFFRNLAKQFVPQQTANWADCIGVTYNRVYIRSQQTKWGSCSSKQNLSFNWRIMQLPDWVREYLVIHELCHLRHFNHSVDFWGLVDQYCGRRREAEAWLKENETVLFSDPLL